MEIPWNSICKFIGILLEIIWNFYCKKTYSLKYDEIIGIERLAQLKDSMLLFARNFEVPFTNNAAERTIRNLKSKSKVAGNFRSDDGARWYLKIRSYMDSARKHGVNAFEAVKLAFAGTPALCLGF